MKLILFGLIFLFSGCGFSYCDLYPAGNSHAGPKCLNCHKHWSGSWHDNKTEGPCTIGG